MNGVAYFQRMALYNSWANQHVLDACADLDAGALAAPRAAFFPSIIRTLNHLLVADRLWLGRLVGTPERLALDTVLHARFDEFCAAREAQDAKIIAFTEQLDADTLASDLSYQSMLAGAYTLQREMILAHMFNHQTHHRGQLHSMLIEAGVKPLAIDLVYYCLEADA
ncbi:DinB family protein [Thalassospira sp. A3_1]|uniref:DinB family protein n=1 Tax=Thalassospira sp. A3_1 TaxID=2821088 RepID=UPI001ADAB821|nr:DinB family protein [Thalassospira sp. A3_1]MBO9506560.1 DinB family protein [Thalassospira sp. A3_1]